MKKNLYCIRKKLVWFIPVIACCFLTGMYIPIDTDEPGPDNDKTVAVNEKIIARWSFDTPNSGRNSVSNNFHARIGRKVGIVPGIKGNAIDFSSNNSKDTGVEISHEVLPAGLNELTFSAWIAPRTLSENATVIRKEDAGVHGENRLLFAIQNQGKFLTLGINCGGNYAECDALVSPQELCDGNWHLAAGTFDGRMMRVYLDGREIGAFERQAPLSTVHDFAPIKTWRDDIASSQYATLEETTVRGVPMFIGSTNGERDVFHGKIDDVRFYAQALDEQAIAKLYSEGKQSLSASAKQAQATAKTLYSKGDSFIETLVATDKNISQPATVNARAALELQRLVRADYPAETNAYIMKWQKSPVDNILLNEKERRSLVEKMATSAFEYLPLTDLQWSVLPKSERSKWERVKEIRSQFDLKEDTLRIAAIDKNQLGKTLYEMENLVEERPKRNEPVAPYVKPQTPKTVDRTAGEARQTLENEWLYQCDGKPTVQRTLDEIGWARKLASRLNLDKNIIDGFNRTFDELEAKAKTKSPELEDKALYFAVRTAKRDLMFKNPVIDFESILYIDNPNPSGGEWNHETRHRLGYQAVPGGRLIVQKGLGPDGKMTKLMPQEPLHGTFWRPDLSYDGKRILFSYKPHNEKTFHIYEIGVDGTNLRQLTGGIFDDFDPIYLPDGKNIMFLTTRGHIYVRCMPPTNAFVMARMPLDTKPGDKNLYIISRSGEPEYTPSVMNDGRVIYTRWEYTDKPLWRAQSLWTMRQNGTLVQTFWGNQSVWPDLLKDARSIPGSDRVMFTGSAHHNWFSGSVGIITPSQGFNFPDGLTKVTQDVEWPECGKAPVNPVESPDYHSAGKYVAYYSPYPLSEKEFIVSAKREGKNGKFVLLLMDTDGNREIINEGEYNIWDAIPIRKRAVPPVQPDMVEWPSWEERNDPKPGILYSNNVYDGAPEELKDKAKYLRIWSIDHKTYTYWFKRNYVSSGPEISAVQSEGIKKIIGTVPIEDDGSVNFVAPSGMALHFQLLDENQRALQTMKSFTGVQPGEPRGCLGCHESHTRTINVTQMGKALQRSPSTVKPVPWDDISVSYERYVQPALDKYCIRCHQSPEQEGYKKFNATLRQGFLGFKEPYMTLLGSPTWGTAYKDRKNTCGGYGWADVIMVESFGTVDAAAYQTYPPMTKLSYKSRLVDLMSSGKHYGVKVDDELLSRVVLWVDAMGPYYGFEELRKMEDPIFQGKDWLSQRPRVQTAPIVPRPGPFDAFETDEAYDTPSPDSYNRLPACVKR